MPPNSAAAKPRTLAGRYRLGHTIGTGATAKVFDAVDLTDNTPVVVKMLPSAFGASGGFLRRFQADVQAAAELSHPNIARVKDFGVERVNDRAYPFVVTDQLAGGSLRGMLDRRRLLSPSQALLVGLDVCRGLDYAHKRGLVHGAVTPSNLLFGLDRKVRIADFGLSKLLGEVAWADPGRVDVDVARYASPEQAQGLPLEPVSDVYTLCLTLIESVTGQVPFAADTTVATLTARVDKLMPVSADLGPLASILERAGRPHTADRATAAQFGRALVQAAEKMPRPAPIPVVGIGLFGDVTGSLPRLIDPAGDRPLDLTAAVNRPPVAPEPPAEGPAPGAATAPADEPTPPASPPRPVVHSIVDDSVSDPAQADVPVFPSEIAAPPISERPLLTRPAPVGDVAGPDIGDEDISGPVITGATITGATITGVPPDGPAITDSALGSATPPRVGRPARPTVPRVFTPNVPPPAEVPPTIARRSGPPSVVEPPSAVTIRPVPAARADVPPATAPAADPTVLPVPSGPAAPPPLLDPGLPVIVPADAGSVVDASPPAGAGDTVEAIDAIDAIDEAGDEAGDAGAEVIGDVTGPIGMVSPEWRHGEPAPKRPSAVVETVEGDDDALNLDRRSVFAYVLVALGLVLAAATLFIGYRALSTPSYTVPNLIGDSEAEAQNEIASNGWTVEVRRQRDDTQAQGDVIRTEPSAGERLKKGSAFVIIVSDGPTLATLPEITGLPIDQARSVLEQAGLSVREADRIFDETVASGYVVSWTVPAQEGLTAGGEVPKGTTVEVVVSTGPAPRTVPNLVGATVAEATEMLADLDLAIGTRTEEFSEQVPAGQIISSTPAAGASATRDTTIAVVVSKGPDRVEVPNVFDKTKAEAEALLAEVDLVVGSVSGPLDGVVKGMDIAPGTKVARGTKVTLVFGPV